MPLWLEDGSKWKSYSSHVHLQALRGPLDYFQAQQAFGVCGLCLGEIDFPSYNHELLSILQSTGYLSC